MPRVTKRVARKDYPNSGIKRGDTYYYWKRKLAYGGVVGRSLTYPKPSQLNSGFAGLIGEIEQSLDAAEDVDGLRTVAEEIRELGQEQQEKFDNMPEGLQQGDTGQLLEERASQCEEWADSIISACDDYDNRIEEIEKLRAEWDAYDTACEPDNATGEEVEEPGDERPDDDAEAEAFNELKEECANAPF
jgi:hypothetical protein